MKAVCLPSLGKSSKQLSCPSTASSSTRETTHTLRGRCLRRLHLPRVYIRNRSRRRDAMTRNCHKTSAALLLGASVEDQTGALIGHLQEFAVAPAGDTGRVSTLVLRGKGAGRKSPLLTVNLGDVQLTDAGSIRLREGAEPGTLAEGNDLLMLERDLLDQQIIDVHGHKVVRVNDVCLVWENAAGEDEGTALRIQEVEIGLRGAVRRLLKGLPASAVEGLATHFRSNAIPWEFVDLIDRDPARRVRLKIDGDRLSKMHPSDIADILEELAPSERHALFSSLNEEVAAEALEEVKPKMQQALIESLDSETVAGIVEEMDPGAAADLLSELSDDRSEAILEEMDPEERREVEDLLEFSADSAAGQMTTEYVALHTEASVGDARETFRNFDGDVELVTDIFLTRDSGEICAVVPVMQLLLAAPDAKLSSLPHGHLVTCELGAPGKKVAELFDKYNLRSLPVVDDGRHLVGVVHAEQVIASLRAKH